MRFILFFFLSFMCAGLSSNFISTFAVEHNFAFIIDNDHNVWCIGSNMYKTLANENVSKILQKPTKIQNLKCIQSISCGSAHTVCYDFDGNLFSFGKNEYGQLGTSDDKSLLSHIPTKVNIPPIYRATCGRYFTMCITTNYLVYSFGANAFGQLGIGSNENSHYPVLIEDLQDVEFIECGDSFSICKTYSNKIYCWGENSRGQLGNENKQSSSKPINTTTYFPKDIISIKCGMSHFLCLTIDGNVYSCGSNSYGKLGLDRADVDIIVITKIENLPEIRLISCGISHSMCIDYNDNLWVFGYNWYGQLGLGDVEDKIKPILNNNIKDIADISHGGSTTYIKTRNEEIYGFGNTEYYQLGFKNEEKKQLLPKHIFKEYEYLWSTSEKRSRAKSARK